MRLRIRVPELLDEHGISAYVLARDSGGRLNESAVYRLVRQQGCVRRFDAEVIETLCEVLHVGITDVLTEEPPPRRKRKPLAPGRKGKGER